MTKPVDLRLDRHLCFTVYAAHHAFTAAYKPWLEPLGLTYPQYLVLLVLWETEGLTVGEIGGRLRLDSGTLTPLLKRMERAGLLLRNRDPADERQVRVELTEHGRGLQPLAGQAHHEIGCALGGATALIDELRVRLEETIEQLMNANSARTR